MLEKKSLVRHRDSIAKTKLGRNIVHLKRTIFKDY